MIKNKKLLTATLLMLGYALLMFQEIAVNQVLCYKKNGTVNLELAVLSLKCICVESHDHPGSPSESQDPGKCVQSLCQYNNCIDQPVNTSWLERDITPNSSGFLFNDQNDPNDHINIKATEALNRFSTPGFLIKLTKFLPNTFFQDNNAILRC
jgi:hypothetical protein